MNRIWIAAVMMALLYGCAGGQGGERSGVMTFSSYFAGATKGAFDCTSHQCTVAVTPTCSMSACGGSLDNDPLNLANGNGNVKITWTLPSGYAFCKQAGDGVFLKDESSDQFKLEAFNGNPSCDSAFTIMAANTKPRPAKPYKYKVIFHKIADASVNPPTIDPTLYVIDPSMVNK